MFTGTLAQALAFRAGAPAAFFGKYVTVGLTVWRVVNVKFESFVGDAGAHAFDGVWVHEGLDFDGEAKFVDDVCNQRASFDAALAASTAGAAVRTWLGGRSAGTGYRLGHDATFSFDDGTTAKVTDAHFAAGGPYYAPCPNWLVSP